LHGGMQGFHRKCGVYGLRPPVLSSSWKVRTETWVFQATFGSQLILLCKAIDYRLTIPPVVIGPLWSISQIMRTSI
jgi:hypothetical protein